MKDGAVDEPERFAAEKPPRFGIEDGDVVDGVAGGMDNEQLAAAQFKPIAVPNQLEPRFRQGY